jgi:hypothetical protein
MMALAWLAYANECTEARLGRSRRCLTRLGREVHRGRRLAGEDVRGEVSCHLERLDRPPHREPVPGGDRLQRRLGPLVDLPSLNMPATCPRADFG